MLWRLISESSSIALSFIYIDLAFSLSPPPSAMARVSRPRSYFLLSAYFSDRGRLFQADRGRRIGVAVAALGKRAGTGVNVS